jgi:hypothetical protein
MPRQGVPADLRPAQYGGRGLPTTAIEEEIGEAITRIASNPGVTATETKRA